MKQEVGQYEIYLRTA